MTQSIDLPAAGLVGVGHEALTTLRDALLRDAGAEAAGALQQAGYAGGDSAHAAFALWLDRQGLPAPESLPVERFGALASQFFSDLGWGAFEFSGGSPVAVIDSPDWMEANGMSGMAHPCCHMGTGLLAGFFGRLANEPLAVMEVECRGAGAVQCRFLIGGAEVMQQVWEGMAAGQDYSEFLGG